MSYHVWLIPLVALALSQIAVIATSVYLHRGLAHRSLRLHLTGTKSNRDAIGAVVRIDHGGENQMRTVRGGSSYLSQSELAATFGVGKADRIDRLIVEWPGGSTQEFKNISAGKAYEVNESKGLIEIAKF